MTQSTPSQLLGTLVRIKRADFFAVELECILGKFEKALFERITLAQEVPFR